MRVLANDGLPPIGVTEFKKRDILVDTKKRNPTELVHDIAEFDGLLVRSATKVTSEIIEAGANGKLQIIGRAGVGIDNVDINAAINMGVVVKSAPCGNSNAAAELTLGLMYALARHIPLAHKTLVKGQWYKKQFEGVELAGKTLGIIGCGRIGSRFANYAQGIGMKVIGFDLFIRDHSHIVLVTKPELLQTADFVSIHTGGKEVVIGAEDIELMKPTAYLLNLSRGGNVDETALYNALISGHLAGAAMDVHKDEPKEEGARFYNKFLLLDNVILTPHIGASTKEAQAKTALEIAQAVINFLINGDYSGAVNTMNIKKEENPQMTYNIFLVHNNVPGVFAKVNEILMKYGLNIKENTSEAFADGKTAHTTYKLYDEPSPEVLAEIKTLADIKRVN